MKHVLFLTPAIMVFAVSSAMAEETGRFTFEKTATGYVRMDSRTGEITVCEDRDGQPVCKSVTGERTANQDELDRLGSKVADLERRLAALESNPILNPRFVLPSEEEFERSLGFMERFFRKFFDIAKEMDKDADTPEKM